MQSEHIGMPPQQAHLITHLDYTAQKVHHMMQMGINELMTHEWIVYD